MDEEENAIETEVGKFASVHSSSDSHEETDDEKKKNKKSKKSKSPAKEEEGNLSLVASESNDPPDLKGVRIIELSPAITSQLLLNTLADANGWTHVTKSAVIEMLIGQGDSDQKLVALRDELVEMDQADVRIRQDTGKFMVNMQQMSKEAVEEDKKRRVQLLEAVIKYPRQWNSLGSEQEVLEGLVINERPLIELEMETRADDLLRPLVLQSRNVGDPYGYAALGPDRRAPQGIRRTRVHASVQAVPELKTTAAQMEPGLPVNAWTQYVYDLEGAQNQGEVLGSEFPPDYKFSQEQYLERSLEYNENFNLYTNDYPLLVKQESDTVLPVTVNFLPIDSLTDVRHVAGLVVVTIAWHPMKSSEVAVLYAPSTRGLVEDHGPTNSVSDVFQRNTILLWSLRDPLKPKLVLNSPREVLVIRWCPVDEDVLVGACASGQIAVWDLAGTWYHGNERPRRQRSLKALQGVLHWFNSSSIQTKSPTALSAMAFSHQGAATDLQWLTPHHRLNSEGHYEQLTTRRFSMQFMTCGEDGAVMIWDLNVVPEGALKVVKKHVEPSNTKYGNTSNRFQTYHRLIRPIYKFIPQVPTLKTKLIFTCLGVDNFSVEYTEILSTHPKAESRTSHVESHRQEEEEDLPEWKSFRPVFTHSDASPSSLPNRNVWLGTQDGQVLLVHWEGFNFDKGEEVTTEAMEAISCCAAVHDGPIVCIDCSPMLPELILTVGGHVVAIWSATQTDAPILSRRAQVRLTFANWSPCRPSLFRVTRMDGTLEVWDLFYRSDRPVLEQSLSGEPLTTMAVNPHLTSQGRIILGVADYRNALQLHYIPQQFQKREPNDIESMRAFMAKEIEIRKKYLLWNAKYCSENADLIQKRKQLVVEENKQDPNDITELTAMLEAAEDKRFAKSRAKTANVSSKEEQKMLSILLNKKNLDKADLMAKQQPLRLLKQVAEEKKEKKKKMMQQLEEQCKKTIAALMPESMDWYKEDTKSDQTILEEIQDDLQRAMADWQLNMQNDQNRGGSQIFKRTLEAQEVLKEGAERRLAVDEALYSRTARQDRYNERQALWKREPPPPLPIIEASVVNQTSLALCRPSLPGEELQVQKVEKAGYPWQTEGGPHLPGGAVSVAHQFLRCTLHQLAPNGVFVQIFHSQIQEKARIEFFKGVAQSLIDFPELTPSTPLLLLLEALNTKKSLTAESVAVVCRNMALYMEMIPTETGPAPPGSPWQALLVQMDLFFRRIVLLLPTLEDILAPVALMPLLLKLPGIGSCKSILDPFGKVLSYAIQNTVVDSHVVVELCQLCGRGFTRDREKLALTRMLIIELVQALKFKTTMPDTNFIMLINFVIQDTGNCLVQTGLVSCLPDAVTAGTNAAEIMRQNLADALDFLADFHTVSKIKSFCQGDTAGLNEDTLGGALKSGVAQYVALEMSRGARDNRAVARHLPWLYNAPSSLQQGPKEFLECMGHVRLLSWLLLGGLFQSLSIHAPCTPVPPEASCHVADHIQVILAGFAEQSKASVLHMSSLFHAFILCQLWTVYLEAGANSNPPGSEPHTAQNTILLDFWGKVTPCILQLVAHSKVLAEMVNLHFLSLLEALLEVNASILGKLMPLWTPVLYAHHTQLPGHLQVRLQNCRHFPPTTPTNNSLLAKWLQRLQFKMGQIELQSSAATQFYSV